MKKFFGIVIFIAVIVFVGWAYMNSGSPANPEPEPTASTVVTVQPTPEEIVTPEPEPEEAKLSVKAVYAGRADSNFIEIKINNKYVTAKLSEQLKANLDNLDIEEEDNVTIEYTLEKGVYVVHKILKN